MIYKHTEQNEPIYETLPLTVPIVKMNDNIPLLACAKEGLTTSIKCVTWKITWTAIIVICVIMLKTTSASWKSISAKSNFMKRGRSRNNSIPVNPKATFLIYRPGSEFLDKSDKLRRSMATCFKDDKSILYEVKHGGYVSLTWSVHPPILFSIKKNFREHIRSCKMNSDKESDVTSILTL